MAYLSQLQSSEPGPVRPLHSLTPYQVRTAPRPNDPEMQQRSLKIQ